jgi:hypothetical protein
MLGDATFYALRRITSNAVEHVSREAMWIAIAATLALSGFIFALIAAYWSIEPLVGPTKAAGCVAGACVLVAVLCFFMPSLMESVKSKEGPALPAGVSPITVAKDEVKAAVDFFGPIRLVSSAFAFGLGLGRRFHRKTSYRHPRIDMESLYFDPRSGVPCVIRPYSSAGRGEGRWDPI